MDWWETASNQADSLAKEWRAKYVSNNREHLSPRLYYEKWTIDLNRTKTLTILNNAICKGISKSRILGYWHRHHNMKIISTTSINWEVNQIAWNRFSCSHCRFYIKYVTGQIRNQQLVTQSKSL